MDEIEPQIESLERALTKLSESLSLDESSEINRDATIQRFEFTFELCWKLLRSVNFFLGTDCFSPRDCIRLAAQNGLIEDPIAWFEYLKMRNLASHTYDEATAKEVYDHTKGFEGEVRKLISRVEEKFKNR